MDAEPTRSDTRRCRFRRGMMSRSGISEIRVLLARAVIVISAVAHRAVSRGALFLCCCVACRDEPADAPDAGPHGCMVTITEAVGAASALCYRDLSDGGRVSALEVISGGSSPVAEVFLEADAVVDQHSLLEGADIRTPGPLPDHLTETNSIGEVTLTHFEAFGNCILHGTCIVLRAFTLTDAGPQLLPGSSYSVRVTAREQVPCELVGTGDTCNALHGSIHSVLEGRVTVDWTF